MLKGYKLARGMFLLNVANKQNIYSFKFSKNPKNCLN